MANAPLFASERNAARLLDMKPSEFRKLWINGHLPRPKIIGDHERWDVDQLRRVLRGDAARPPEEDFEL